MSEDKVKNLIQPEVDMINIAFSLPEIEVLLETLSVARSAATILAKTELTKGSAAGSTKMNKVAAHANELMRIVSESARIGQPESEERN